MDEKHLKKAGTLHAKIKKKSKPKTSFFFFICKFDSKTSCIYIKEIKSHLSELQSSTYLISAISLVSNIL